MPKLETLVLAMLAIAALAALPAEARRASGIRNTTYCASGGCYSRDPSSGFYRHRLNSDGGIARPSDGPRARRVRN